MSSHRYGACLYILALCRRAHMHLSVHTCTWRHLIIVSRLSQLWHTIPLEGPVIVIDDKVHKDLTKNSQISMWHHTKEDHLKTPKFDEKYNSSSSSLDCIGYDLTKSTIKRLYSSIGYDLIMSTTKGIYSFTLSSIRLSSFGRQFSRLLTWNIGWIQLNLDKSII